MQKFDESFYTDDFDQEILDWLIAEGYAVWDTHGHTPLLDRLHLRCASATAFWTTSNPPTFDFGSYLTKNQFKEKIGMTKNKPLLENYFVKPNEMCEEIPNTFTKSMLVSGKHIVETCQGDRYLVAGDYIIGLKGYHGLKDYSNSLEESTYGDSEWDIEKVYSGQGDLNSDSIRAGQGFYSYLESEKLTLIWQRETPEQAQKRIRRQELEEKVVVLRQELKQVENELQEL